MAPPPMGMALTAGVDQTREPSVLRIVFRKREKSTVSPFLGQTDIDIQLERVRKLGTRSRKSTAKAIEQYA